MNLNDTSVSVGDSLSIAVEVSNTGGDGTYQANLVVDGDIVASESVFIPAGQTRRIVFEQEFDEPGTKRIAVGSLNVGQLYVAPEGGETTVTPGSTTETGAPGEEGDGDIEIVEATLPADWVREGTNATLLVTVQNSINRTATRSLTVTIDDQPVATRAVTLEPDQRAIVRIGFEARNGTVAVDGVTAGQVEVRSRTDANAGPAAGGAGPGVMTLGVFIAIIAAVMVVVVGATRWNT